jgi:ribonuclease HI
MPCAVTIAHPGLLSFAGRWPRSSSVPWLKVSLRGQKVLARVQADGAFAAEGGRVEIRYRPTDPRVYRAAARNLERIDGEELLPDDTVVSGEEVPAAAKSASGGEKKRSSTGSGSGTRTETGPVPEGAWTVYADGACSGNPGPAGLGVVLIAPDGQRLEGYEYLGTATNNIAELTAILRAAEIVPEGAPAVVHTDSQYSIGVLTKGWKAKANQELVARVKGALAGRRGWQLRYVPGHAGVPLNERADELAREAVSRRASRMPSRDAGADRTT